MLNKILDPTVIYLAFALLVGIITFLLIPRKVYKRYFLYGLIFGGIGDTILVALLKYMNFIRYKNMGVFDVYGLFSIWTPLTWMFAFMLFFYYLPVRKTFLIPYILAFVGMNMAVGAVLKQFGLFERIGIYNYISPFVLALWHGISAWVYLKNGRIELK